MRKIKIEVVTELRIKGILGFIQRRVTSFGNGAKVDCPKEYLGKTVYLVIPENELSKVEKSDYKTPQRKRDVKRRT